MGFGKSRITRLDDLVVGRLMLRLAEGLLRSGVCGWNAVAVAARTADRTRFLMIMMIVATNIIHSLIFILPSQPIINQGTFSDLDGAVSLPSLIVRLPSSTLQCLNFVRVDC